MPLEDTAARRSGAERRYIIRAAFAATLREAAFARCCPVVYQARCARHAIRAGVARDAL